MSVSRFMSRPKYFEAIQFTGNDSAMDIFKFAGSPPIMANLDPATGLCKCLYLALSDHYEMISVDDWLVREECRTFPVWRVYSNANFMSRFMPAQMMDTKGHPIVEHELAQALYLTVEYVGNDLLPPVVGWDWFDALSKYDPELAQRFVDKPIHMNITKKDDK